MSLYLKLAAILIPAIVAGALGYHLGAGRWESRYEALEAQGWQQKARGEETARKALESQLRDAKTYSANNAQVLRDLQDQTASIVADRDRARELARRLLAAGQARTTPASSGVPEAGDRPAAAPAGPDERDGLADRLARVATECRLNAAQLNGLIAQIQPQL